MTAEIGIMNKMGVALAADSAVTITQEKGQKIYNSANKLFMLSKHSPIGIMIYGSAVFMDIPWETIIKRYRAHIGIKKFNYLKEYSDNFIGFLNAQLVSKEKQLDYLKFNILSYFSLIKEEIIEAINNNLRKNKSISQKEIIKLVSESINKHHETWLKYKLLDKINKTDEKNFSTKHKKLILKFINEAFEKLPLSDLNIKQLLKISSSLFYRERFPNNISGIVIAGFGENEIFPALQTFAIECIIENKLKYKKISSTEINLKKSASIMPFAQRETVDSFITGIDPNLEKLSNSYLQKIFENYPKTILDQIEIENSDKKNRILKKITKTSKELFEDYMKKIEKYRKVKHINPIVQIVAILPKDELAAMAETLVNLTSFKRRVSADAETVGGPIDVAIISKGDGFIWIKRKHYFNPELNHHFFKNYY